MLKNANKIMIIVLDMKSGGTERVVANISNYLSNKNEVVLETILKEQNDYEVYNKIKTKCIDKKKYNKMSKFEKKINIFSIYRIVKIQNSIIKENPNIILCFLPLASFYLMILKKMNKRINKIPVILSERADPKRTFKNKMIYKIMKFLYKSCDGFVFQTKEAQKFYKDIIKCESAIISNPLNEDFIKKEISHNRKKIIVSVGRLEIQKNNKLLIDAFETINKKYKNYKLLFYGEGSLKRELELYVKNKNLVNEIKFMGRSKNLQQDIYDASIFVLSSFFEGMPNALMEAMAMGIPCISTDCPVGGPKLLIENDVNGILIKNNNKKELIDAMEKIINNQKFSDNIAKNALNICKKYNPKVINMEWEKYITKVINNKEG